MLLLFAPDSQETSINFYDSIRFIHPSANWSGVRCPICHADAQEWWSEVVNSAYPSGVFSDLNVIAPCCGATVSLNAMEYLWPAAFGSFMLDAMNPNIPNLSDEQLHQLESCLRCRLKCVWAHI
ncbi:MAG: hypothetical protein DWQ37_04435 [Planctomycetota bacterium]|nr:MAG: hypothetical protein DWQ37_04435 [Planctomycetota bacterium]